MKSELTSHNTKNKQKTQLINPNSHSSIPLKCNKQRIIKQGNS